MFKKEKFEKWPFLGQNHELTPLEKCQFFYFLNFMLLQPRMRFFVVEYHKRHFPGLYCQKKKFEKWPFLYQNHGLTPLKKCQFFHFLNFNFFFSLERRFIVLEYHKRHFPGLNCLKKKKVEKMAIFIPKSRVNRL